MIAKKNALKRRPSAADTSIQYPILHPIHPFAKKKIHIHKGHYLKLRLMQEIKLTIKKQRKNKIRCIDQMVAEEAEMLQRDIQEKTKKQEE